ncbi:transposase [Castellaniella sp.]|uniref:transposase n=1 Tax=Castellaniella sp. TaxID=1955812 RepID=UPI00345D1A26
MAAAQAITRTIRALALRHERSTESSHSKMERLSGRAYGFRNFENWRTRGPPHARLSGYHPGYVIPVLSMGY